jgi:hypothetical protein
MTTCDMYYVWFVAVTSHFDVVLNIPVYYEGKIIDVKNTTLAHVEYTIN